MRWQIKFAKNAIFGLIPGSDRLRRLKRRFSKFPTAISPWTLEEGLRQVELMRQAGCDLRGKVVLEIGAGWQPTIPLLFSLCGAARVITVDTQRLMDADTFAGTVRNLAPHAGTIESRLGLAGVASRLDASGTLDQLLARFRFDYRAPFDLTRDDVGTPVDVATSRAVFEHVPPPVLRSILDRLRTVIRPGGWTCHAIDNSDHWSHADARLHKLSFLSYGDRAFGLLNRFNPLDYQNRLRHSDYLRMFVEAGFEVLVERAETDVRARQALSSMRLAGRFREMDPDDLAKTDSYIVARNPVV